MLLNHYTAFLEKHLQGRLGSMLNENGITISFSSLLYQSKETLLPLLLHQTASVIVGSDNTAETGESWRLKKEITSSLNTALTRSVVDNDDGSHSSVVVATITNISTGSITIGEIGLRVNAQNLSATSLVIDRTPLGTPLTIQPGEVGRIVYTITMA